MASDAELQRAIARTLPREARDRFQAHHARKTGLPFQQRSMPTRLDFELSLLRTMCRPYRVRMAVELGLGAEQLNAAAQRAGLQSRLGFLDDVAWYTSVLGTPAVTVEAESGVRASRFSLELWPRMTWQVMSRRDGATWGFGFHKKATTPPTNPRHIDAGAWTRAVLEASIDGWDVVESWDEQHVARLKTDESTYEARFRWNLLESWKPLDAAPGA